jgi:hypothetical protein
MIQMMVELVFLRKKRRSIETQKARYASSTIRKSEIKIKMRLSMSFFIIIFSLTSLFFNKLINFPNKISNLRDKIIHISWIIWSTKIKIYNMIIGLFHIYQVPVRYLFTSISSINGV